MNSCSGFVEVLSVSDDVSTETCFGVVLVSVVEESSCFLFSVTRSLNVKVVGPCPLVSKKSSSSGFFKGESGLPLLFFLVSVELLELLDVEESDSDPSLALLLRRTSILTLVLLFLSSSSSESLDEDDDDEELE